MSLSIVKVEYLNSRMLNRGSNAGKGMSKTAVVGEAETACCVQFCEITHLFGNLSKGSKARRLRGNE